MILARHAVPYGTVAWWYGIILLTLPFYIIPLCFKLAHLYMFLRGFYVRWKWNHWTVAQKAGWMLQQQVNNEPVRVENKQGVVVAELKQKPDSEGAPQ